MEEMIVLIGNFGFPVAGKLEGMKVLLTRERDIYVTLVDRVALSRRAGGQRPDDCYAENAFKGKVNEAVAVVGKKVSRPVDQLYWVQVGIFSFIENARQRLAEAQKTGFNVTFITQKLPLN